MEDGRDSVQGGIVAVRHAVLSTLHGHHNSVSFCCKTGTGVIQLTWLQHWAAFVNLLHVVPVQLFFPHVDFFCALDHVLELDGVLLRGFEVLIFVVYFTQLVDDGIDVL